MTQNIRPYLELIGFGELASKMSAPDFILASILTDALDQAVDNCEEKEVDAWYLLHGEPRTYQQFRLGVCDLAYKRTTSKVPKEIIALADLLLTLLPPVKQTLTLCKSKLSKATARRKCHSRPT